MLDIKNLSVSYGAIDAVKGISLHVDDGEIVSLIGANGAGKTTTLHTITGLVPAKSGSIVFNGQDLLKTKANKIVTLGMAHVPEGRHVFTRMSVQENLEMGAYSLKDTSHVAEDLDKVYTYFPRLKERRRQLAGTLSGGEQQMVAMGRAIMSRPNTILMDEPSMGLSPKLVKEIFRIIEKLHEEGITVLLVEQNAKMALSIADRAYVLETGRITMEGKASDLLHDEKVRKAYLGARANATHVKGRERGSCFLPFLVLGLGIPVCRLIDSAHRVTIPSHSWQIESRLWLMGTVSASCAIAQLHGGQIVS